MDRFTIRKDNLAGNSIIGLGSDPFYLGIPNLDLAKAILDFLNGRFEDAELSRQAWLERTGRELPTT
jgi:hypothetical protein